MPKLAILGWLLILVALSPVTSAQNLLSQPESVEYDIANQRYLVSNWSNGNIIQVDLDGRQSIFDDALTSVAGLHINGNILYAASNDGPLEGLVLYDLSGDSMLMHVPISALGTINDITTDTAGWVYATEWSYNMLYKIRPEDSTVSRFVTSALDGANGIVYDGPNNRLLVCTGGGLNGYLIAVDIDDSSRTTVATTAGGGADGLSRDALGNYYYSRWAPETVFRWDNGFGETAVPFSTNHDGPADFICNNYLMELAVPNFNGNRLDRLPLLVDARTDSDWGFAPLSVQFEGWTELTAVEWIWDFGDGDSAFVQSPDHVYALPGIYDVNLMLITAGNDTLVRRRPDYVTALADSLWADSVGVLPDSAVEVSIYAVNIAGLDQMTIPVTFAGDLDFDPVAVTWSTAGCRTEDFELSVIHSDPAGKEITFQLTPPAGVHTLPPGRGPVLRLGFTMPDDADIDQTTPVDLGGYRDYSPEFTAAFGAYAPVTVPGAVTYLTCCVGITGNMDGDPLEEISIGDLVWLVEYMFGGGPEPVCFYEGNMDGDPAHEISISDLVHLVNYMFQSGPEPLPCL